MKIRPIRDGDLKQIDDIYQRCHQGKIQLPSLSNQITSAVVEIQGRVVGFGIVKAFAEAIMLLDTQELRVHRIHAMDLLMLEAFRGCASAQVEQVHVAIHDERLEKILKKHYGYDNRVGTILYREI
jgi:hypothetical protein